MQARENSFTLEQLEFATGHLLDEFGGYCDLERLACEPDNVFRDRIRTQSLRSILVVPRSANAIKASDATLRDYFAAKAIQGMFANDSLLKRYAEDGMVNMVSPEVLATTAAYSIADAMLAERAK